MVFKPLHELPHFKPPPCAQLHQPCHTLRAFKHDSLCLDCSALTKTLFTYLITIHTWELRPNSTSRKMPLLIPDQMRCSTLAFSEYPCFPETLIIFKLNSVCFTYQTMSKVRAKGRDYTYLVLCTVPCTYERLSVHLQMN